MAEDTSTRITEAQERAKQRAAGSSPIARSNEEVGALNTKEEELLSELSFRLKTFSGESVDLERREEILARAIKVNSEVQKSGSLKSKRESLKRLNFIKENLDERTIGLEEGKREEFLDLYDEAIKQTQNNISLTADLGKSFKESVKSNIPSASDFTAALSAENPLFGAAASFVKDLVVDRLVRIKSEKDEKSARLDALSEQADSYAAVSETEDLRKDDLLEQQKERKTGKTPLVDRMQEVVDSNKRIELGVNELIRIWDGEVPEAVDTLERIEKNDEQLKEIQKDTLENQQNRIEKQETSSINDRFDMLEAERESKDADIVKMGVDKKEKDEGDSSFAFLRSGVGTIVAGLLGAGLAGLGIGTAIEALFGDNEQYQKFWDTLFSNIEGAASGFSKYGMDSIFGFVDYVFDGMKQNASDNREAIRDYMNNMLEDLKSSIFGVIDSFILSFTEFGDNISNAFSNPKEMFNRLVSDGDSKFGSILGSIFSGDEEGVEQDRVSGNIPRRGANEMQDAKAVAEQKNQQAMIFNNQTNVSGGGQGGDNTPMFMTRPSSRTSENTIRRSNDKDFSGAF